MQDVADYRYIQPLDPAFIFTNCEGIQQRLSWMFMRAIAGIYDRRVAHSRQMMGRPRHGMSNNDTVGRHGFEVPRCVEKCFSLRNARAGDTDINGISGKTLCRNLKGRSCARGGLEKEVNYCSTPKRGDLLYFSFRDIAKGFSCVQQMSDFICVEFANAQ